MRITVFGILVLATFIQVTALESVRLFGVKPDLVLILLIFYAFLRGTREGSFWGFVAGFLKDVATGGYFGLNALDHLAAGYLAGLMQTVLYKDNPFVVATITLLICLFQGLIHYLLLFYLGIFISPGVGLGKIIFCGSVYNGAVALLLYRWFFRTYTRVYP